MFGDCNLPTVLFNFLMVCISIVIPAFLADYNTKAGIFYSANASAEDVLELEAKYEYSESSETEESSDEEDRSRRGSKSGSKSRESSNTSDTLDGNGTGGRGRAKRSLSKLAKINQRVANFYRAPVVNFIEFFISQILFIWMFAYVLVYEFCESPHYVEYLLLVYVVTILLEEIRQLFRSGAYLSEMIIGYLTDYWNVMDLVMIVCFFLAFIRRAIFWGLVWV